MGRPKAPFRLVRVIRVPPLEREHPRNPVIELCWTWPTASYSEPVSRPPRRHRVPTNGNTISRDSQTFGAPWVRFRLPMTAMQAALLTGGRFQRMGAIAATSFWRRAGRAAL